MMKQAFTMAEILLSLTIIGVVAAITLPSLTGNINERTWNTQRKALYARFSQAIALMPALNGYGTLTAEQKDDDGNTTQSAVDTAAETFITDGLSKVLKINNICDTEHLQDCGVSNKITTLKGNILNDFTTNYCTLAKFNTMFDGVYTMGNGIVGGEYHQTDTKAAAFETVNGESIIAYYNPNCAPSMGETTTFYVQKKVCANFVYDLNGSKGPNTMGKDIGFLTVLYPSDSVVAAPIPSVSGYNSSDKAFDIAVQGCRNVDNESRLPNDEEAIALFVNKVLLYGNERNGSIFTATKIVDNGTIKNRWLNLNTGRLSAGGNNGYWCVRR